MSRLAQAFRRAAAAGTIEAWSLTSLSLPEQGRGLMAITGAPAQSTEPRLVRVSRHGQPPALPSTVAPRRPLLQPDAIPREEIADLAQRLYDAGSVRDRNRAVLFTSVGREGRSARLSAAVADVLSRSSSASVCLVDANLRAPVLHQLFGVKAGAGLSDVLVEACTLEAALVRLGPNFWLLPGGAESADAVSRLTSDVVGPCVEDLLASFDYLVIDTSAANVHRDAATLAPLVDGTVLVVSANATRRETGRHTVDELEQRGASIVGVVLLDRTFPIPDAIYRRL